MIGAGDGGRRRTFARAALVLAVLTGVGLRVGFVLQARADPFFEAPLLDAAYHLDWARAILRGESFVAGPYFRAPLYPWFLAGTLRLCGGPTASLLGPRLVQAILLGGATILLVARLAQRIGGLAAAVPAAWLAALAWPLAAYDAELLVPTLYVPLCLAAVELLLSALDQRRGALALVLAGLAHGLAALARPNVLLFVPLAAVGLLRGRRRARPRGLTSAGAFLLGVLLPIAPVTLRNARGPAGAPVLISSAAGLNLWIGNHPRADGTSAVAPGLRPDLAGMIADARAAARAESGRALDDAAVSRHYARKALAAVRADPARALGLAWFKTRLFCSGVELPNTRPLRFFARRFAPLSRAFVFDFGLLALLATAGAAATIRTSPAARWVLAFTLVHALGVIAFFVNDRFRAPAVPFLCVLVGALPASLWRARRAPRHLAAALLTLLAAWAAGVGRGTPSVPEFLGPGRIPPPAAAGHWLLGSHFATLNDWMVAEREYRAALELHPRLWAARADLGALLLERGRTAEARPQIERALALYPAPRTWALLAELELREGRCPAALEAARKSRDAGPGAEGSLVLGRTTLACGAAREAVAAFALALERASAPAEAAAARAGWLAALLAAGARDEARALLASWTAAGLDRAEREHLGRLLAE